jgi:hypothetical protein
VSTPPLAAPLDLGRLAAHINMPGVPTDEGQRGELEMHLRAAVEVVEAACGALLAREVTALVPARRGGVLLPVGPVLELLEVTDVASGAAVTAAMDDVGFLVPAWIGHVGPLRVRLRIGRDPVPDSLVLATLIIASHLWETQRGRSARPGILGPDEVAVPQGFAVPNRALQLMAAHRLVKVG